MTTKEVLERGGDAGGGFIPGSRNLKNHVSLRHTPTSTSFSAVMVEESSGKVYTGHAQGYKVADCEFATKAEN